MISLADILHCENPIEVEDNWIKEYNLSVGNFDITEVDTDLVDNIPTATQIGKVYMKLILDTLQPNENYVDGIIRIYNR